MKKMLILALAVILTLALAVPAAAENGSPVAPETSDTTTSTTTKGSPKTFDAGIGIYALTAVLSVTGMAWTAKKRH